MADILGKIHRGDCIAGMKKMSAGSVQLVFADPPFNIGYEYDEYDDRKESEAYLDWSRDWIKQVHRVLTDDGTFWLAIGDEYAAELKLIAQNDAGFHCRSWVIWYYTFGVNCQKKFNRSHAHLFHFVKDPKQFTFNDEAIRVPSARQLVYGDKRANPRGRLPDDTWILRPQDVGEGGFAPDHDAWYFPRVAGTFKERAGFHGCQMPEQLLGRIIRVSSNEGDTVMDPFTGSGTTLVVAKKLHREWIGFELSKEYAAQARKRLKNSAAGNNLIGASDPAISAPRTTDRIHQSTRKVSAAPAIKKQIAGLANTNNGSSLHSQIGDSDQLIVQAYLSTHNGLSSDRLIVDPELNSRFIDECGRLRIPGDAFHWNRRLLALRKAKKLPKTPVSRERILTNTLIQRFSFASEMAIAYLCRSNKASLDDTLCHPSWVVEFDRFANSINPGISPLQYRWLALYVRKQARLWRRHLPKDNSEVKKPIRTKPRELSECLKGRSGCHGAYVLMTPKQDALFAGTTTDLVLRFQNHHYEENPALYQLGFPLKASELLVLTKQERTKSPDELNRLHGNCLAHFVDTWNFRPNQEFPKNQEAA